jgi:hypothetical protein
MGAEFQASHTLAIAAKILCGPFVDLFEKPDTGVSANGDGRVPITTDVPLAA